jgi:hypothetical protein
MSRAGDQQNRAEPKTHDRSSIPMTKPCLGASGLMALFATPVSDTAKLSLVDSVVIY